MSPLFRKKNTLEKRLKRIEKELASVHSNLKTLKKKASSGRGVPRRGAGRGRDSAQESPSRSTAGTRPKNTDQVAARKQGQSKQFKNAERDDRLADYLSGSFEGAGPLRHERRIIRNRAILMVVIVSIILLGLLYNILS